MFKTETLTHAVFFLNLRSSERSKLDALTVASPGESKMTQTGVFRGSLENDDSNRKNERWFLSSEFETHFSCKTDWFGDLNIFQKLGSNS